MRAKTTWIWLVLAVTLFAFIVIFQHFQHSRRIPSANILDGFRPAEVTSVQVIPSGALEIRADLTNGNWFLTKPISYPAQTAAIQSLLDSLKNLTFATRIGATELREHKTSDADFGFDNPQFSIEIHTPDNRWQILVGNKTPPGDQVFMRVVGEDGAFVTDAKWLDAIPRSATVWRDTSLVSAAEKDFDSIILSNNAKGLVIELHQNPTNHLWRMTRPLQSRADSERITAALQQLQSARITRFVTDDSNADLSVFGLQPAEMVFCLGHGTNFTTGFRIGKAITNDTTQIFARRKNYNAIVTTSKDTLSTWFGSVNSFRDPLLMEFTAEPAEIEVRGENNFTLRRDGTNAWTIAGEKFSADADEVQLFIKILASLRVKDFVKDVVTAPDLESYGLNKPTREIIVRSGGDTNSVIADLSFAVTTNGIYVHRADEDFIYSISPSDFNRLPENAFEFRDRGIWHFSEKDVAQITMKQNGKTRVVVRTGDNKWSLAPGSVGIINPPALEETAHRFGQLDARPYGWVGRNAVEADRYGWNTNNLQVTFELKDGQKLSVDFGAELPSAHTALAAVTLDGERWAFIFPPTLYQFVLSYLTIPANVP
ncbi:MAG TPA: DUF4340 domain-containing protein [Verrucomicrobiae bacterium]|nr:DUF4340 domain-containing protein [Verrucomicrobiae bacterium]